MIVALVIFVTTIIIAVVKSIKEQDSIGWVLLSALFGALVGVAAVIIFNFFSFFAPIETVPNQPVELYGLRNDSEVEGSFFLGIGSINEDQTAYYSIIEEDGGIVFKNIPLEDIRIYEDNPGTPYLQTYHNELKTSWKYVFILPVTRTTKPSEFHIPSGSVYHGYSIE